MFKRCIRVLVTQTEQQGLTLLRPRLAPDGYVVTPLR
jgi:hypothetical protein